MSVEVSGRFVHFVGTGRADMDGILLANVEVG